MKLPEQIKYEDENGEVLVQPTQDFIKNLAKQHKIKDAGGVSARDTVKNILTLAFRSKEVDDLPEGNEHLEALLENCVEIANEHRKITETEEAENKEKKEKVRQEREMAKEAKEKEEKEYTQSQSKFEEMFIKKAKALSEKTESNVKKAMEGIVLPKTIALAGNSMGVVIGDAATKDDIATAAATVFAATDGNSQLKGCLQFVIGDLVNSSVKAKVFRTKGDACKQIQFLIEEKLEKKFALGSVNALALQSERIPVDQRKLGVPPSFYYLASKVTAPRLKEADAKQVEALDKEFSEERNNIINDINNGKLTSVNDIKSRVEVFAKSKGFGGNNAGEVRKAMFKYLNRLFYAVWIKESLVSGDSAKLREVSTEAGIMEYTVGDLTDIQTEALNQLQNILISSKYDVTKLLEGKITENVDGKDVEKDYLLTDPFEDPKAAPTKESADEKKEDKGEEKAEDENKDEDEDEDEDGEV